MDPLLFPEEEQQEVPSPQSHLEQQQVSSTTKNMADVTPTTCPTINNSNGTNNNNNHRKTAWWQGSVVRRSSSAVDEAVDELTEKSQFLLRRSSPRSSFVTEEQHSSSSTCGATTTVTAAAEGGGESRAIALFDREEIQVGRLLGEGTFSSVYEVTGFSLIEEEEEGEGEDEEDGMDGSNGNDNDTGNGRTARKVRQDLASTSEPSNYALKHLKPDLLAVTRDFESAATDLVMEAKYLSALDHPGILKLRGLALGGTAVFTNTGHHDGYFLLTDRLVETLAQRIERWQQLSRSQAKEEEEDSLEPRPDVRGTNTVACKTRYALEIADAIAYLHNQRIIFRDLKPSNIGFNNLDKVQLFDFGLCRELPPESQARPYKYYPPMAAEELEDYYASLDESWNDYHDEWKKDLLEHGTGTGVPYEEEVYFMSGAGTQIYMAVEILINNRYNMKCDVYSWAMVYYEMLTLKRPFPLYTMEEHVQYVCKEEDRPCLDHLDHLDEHEEDTKHAIPDSLKDLLKAAWIGDVSKRLSMNQVCQQLQEISHDIAVAEAERGEDEEEDDDDEATPPHRLTGRILEKASDIKEGILSLLNRTFQSLLSLFRKSREEVVTDTLPLFLRQMAYKNEGAMETAASDETAAPYSKSSVEEQGDQEFPSEQRSENALQEQRSALLGTSPSLSSSFNGGPTKTPVAQVFQHNRHSLFRRNHSSASTTNTTDDEYDDDDVMFRGSILKTMGSMEVVVERRADSERSTVC